MEGQGGRPRESEVGGRVRLKWEAVGVRGGRPRESEVGGLSPWESEVGGRVSPKWEAEVGGQGERLR